MSKQPKELLLAGRIYDLDSRIYEATGSTLGKVYPAAKAISVNLIVKHLCCDKNRFLKSEMILLKNMLKPLEGTEIYDQLLSEYDALVEEIEAFDVDAVFFRSGLEAISGNCPVIPADKKVIVCISRQYGCRGQDIGVSLAKRTGFPYFDKDILAMACESFHLDEHSVSDYNSAEDTINSSSSRFPRMPKLGSVTHDTLYFKERGIIQDIAEKTNAIILGRCADHILDKLHIPHISIYLCAPLEKRIQVEMARSNVNASMAKKTIQQVDRSRQAFYKYYTGRNWGSPEYYNACLNTSVYGVKGTVSLIEDIINMRYQGWE